MTYLSEDPTFLAGALLLLAGAFLIALNVTKQGKYLIRAGIAIGLALLVVLIEWMWVTDTERIEMVVYDVRQAVLKSDADAVIAHLSPHAVYLHQDTALSPEETRGFIRSNLSRVRLEFARITELQTSVGQQSRRGKAEFRVFTRGSLSTVADATGGITTVTGWSLGFQETEPGIWKITRISPLSLQKGILAFPGDLAPPDESQIGMNNAVGVPWPNEAQKNNVPDDQLTRPFSKRPRGENQATNSGESSKARSSSRRGRARGNRKDAVLPDNAPKLN